MLMIQSSDLEKHNADLVRRSFEMESDVHNRTGNFVALLCEIEELKSYRASGYSSLFTFLREGHKLSEGAAARRVHSVRAVNKVPQCLAALREKRVTLCSLSTISGIITEANCEQLFRAAERMSKHELKQFVEDMKTQARREAEEAVRRAEAEKMPLFTGVAESGDELQGAVSSEVAESRAESAQQEQSSASVIETAATEQVQTTQSIEARTSVGGSVERQTFALIPYQIPASAFA